MSDFSWLLGVKCAEAHNLLHVDLDERWNELSCFSKVRACCLSTNRKKCAHHRNPHNTNIQTLNFIGTQPTNQVMPILPIHHSTAISTLFRVALKLLVSSQEN